MPWTKGVTVPEKHSAHLTGPRPSTVSAKLDGGVGSKGLNNGNGTSGGDRKTAQLGKSEAKYHKEPIRKGVPTPVKNAKGPTHESRALKSLLGAVSAVYVHYEGTPPDADKVEHLISRIIALEELLESPPVDAAEQNLRGELIQKLYAIEGRFRLLCGEKKPQGVQEIENIHELLEDLREGISDHWIAQKTEFHSQELNLISPDEAAVLNSFCCSQGVEFWDGNRRGCLRGTRTAVLEEIELWARDFSRPPVFWLNGLARTGKTVIAQTIAERTFADGHLGVSFFCSRNFEDRSKPSLILPTIAVQLARKYPDFRSSLVSLVLSNPGITRGALFDQMQNLITRPLMESDISTVIIIDALDECKDGELTSAILSALARLAPEIPKVKFLITSRPETRIQEGFRLPFLAEATDVFVLHEVKRSQADNDIRLFFRRKFSEFVQHRRSLAGWPTEGQLDALCERAAGSFVYAVAAVEFITQRILNPEKRLDLLLQSPGATIHKGKKVNENTTLDSFYASVLQEAFGGGHDPDNDTKIRSVLGAMVLVANSLSPYSIAKLLDFDIYGVLHPLLSTRLPLACPEDIHDPILPFSQSFTGFIVDPDRCTNKRFQVSLPTHHLQLLMGCLDLMGRSLEENMCHLPDGVANSDASDLWGQVERHIHPALRYACKSWHTHLVDRRTKSVDTSGTAPAVHRFLESKFLCWLEVLSVLGAVGNAVDALQAVADWLEESPKESPTLDLVNDCSRFVTGYFEIINTSCRHIYHSALPLTPKSSIIRKLYEGHARPFTRVVRGVPASWDSATLARRYPFSIELVAWSPCNRYLAISPAHTVTVAILCSTTLRRLQSLEFSPKISSRPLALIFSPKSHILTCSGAGLYSDEELFVVSWGVRTNCIISSIEHRGPKNLLNGRPLITYSESGRTVAVLYRYYSFATISIYDVFSGVYMHNVPHGVNVNPSLPGGLCFYGIWTHGESLLFATAEPTTITVRAVGFTSNSTPWQVRTFSVPANIHHTEVFKQAFPDSTVRARFLPGSNRLALIHPSWPPSKIVVWDPQRSKPLFLGTDNHFRSSITLSSDGHFLACPTTGPEVYLWRKTSSGYVLTAKFPCDSQDPSSLLSPNGESIVVYGDSTIRIWHTKDLPTTTGNNNNNTASATSTSFTTAATSTVSTQPPKTENFILAFHPVRPLAAVARRKDSTVTILDLKSGLPQLTINTGVDVHGLGVIGNAVIVVGNGEVVTWNLPEGNRLLYTRMGTQDRASTVFLRDDCQNEVIAASTSPDLRYVALVTIVNERRRLFVYGASTGKRVGHATTEGNTLWFTPSGSDIWIWCAVGNRAGVWTVSEDGLRYLASVDAVDEGCRIYPWGSSRGYKATKDGWILGPDGKRLLMSPPSGRSDAAQWVSNGQYLALLHSILPEPVILELGS